MKIGLLNSLFKARQDVFAIHWQKGKRNGYMPAYSYDPYMYQLHRRNGGTFKDYKDKTYLPLTDNQINKHLNGEKLIGIYPLLKDNTSWFVAADFDKKSWVEDCRNFLHICDEKIFQPIWNDLVRVTVDMCGCFLTIPIPQKKAEKSL